MSTTIPFRHSSGQIGGVGQQKETPGYWSSGCPRPNLQNNLKTLKKIPLNEDLEMLYGYGKFHLLQGERQATVRPFLLILKSPTWFSLSGQASRETAHLVVTQVPS